MEGLYTNVEKAKNIAAGKWFTHEEWIAEATRLFGEDAMRWRFICPVCGHIATVQDWKDAGASEGSVAFSCIGRFLPECVDAFSITGDARGGPCNYTGGGLFRLNPVTVTKDEAEHQVFDFAPVTGTAYLQIDTSALSGAEVDSDGYLRPGVPFTADGQPIRFSNSTEDTMP